MKFQKISMIRSKIIERGHDFKGAPLQNNK